VLVYALDIGFIGSPIGFTLASILAPVFLYFCTGPFSVCLSIYVS
jgi:hypothetical protein